MPAIRLAIIGGGSPYMTSMFSSLARYAASGSLSGSSIVLYDLDRKSAGLMRTWGNAGAENDNIPISFSLADSLEEALTGADFVLSCIRPGGLDGRYYDESIPLKYGELGIETVGVGGLFMALRCLPVVKEIAEKIQLYCPEAWLINYTNPTNMVTDVSTKAGHTRTLGLCDGVWGVKWLAAKLLNLPTSAASQIQAYVSGINHFTWTVKLFHNNRDLYPLLDSMISNKDLSGLAGYETIDDNPELNDVEVDACRLYHYYGVLPGSVYYARYYYNLRKLLKHHLAPGFELRSTWLKQLGKEKKDSIQAQLEKGTASLVPHNLEDAAHGDQAIGVINAIANDTGLIETANVINNGAVSFLPDDAVVEVSCSMSKAGAIPAAAGTIPFALQGMIRDAYTFSSLAVEAALTGNKKLVLQAAMAHPAHRDLDTIEKVISELFEVHKDYLPQFTDLSKK
jgi:6-phospho-beta-glucosidase